MEANRVVFLCKTMNQKQYHILRGITEANATMKNLKYAGMVGSTTFFFNSLIWPMQKADGS